MMKKIIKSTLLLISLFGAGVILQTFLSTEVSAAAPPECEGSSAYVCTSTVESLTGTGGVLTNVINVMLFAAGIIAVVMVIVGGIRYVTSDGDSGRANQAKNTIIYAIIGLVVAVMSFSIVNFVIGKI